MNPPNSMSPRPDAFLEPAVPRSVPPRSDARSAPKSSRAAIQRKLMAMVLFTSSTVLVLTCAAFFTYELVAFRNSLAEQLSTTGDILAANSTAALTFGNPEDATEVLAALAAESHIVVAGLYDTDGKLFARYPSNAPAGAFPATPAPAGRSFTRTHLATFQPVIQDGKRRGTLFLKSDLNALYDRLKLYGWIVLGVLGGSSLLAYLLATALQKQISRPVLALAEAARAVSEHQDYTVRAARCGEDEFGLLTDTFNHMLEQIQHRDLALKKAQQQLQEYAQDLEQRVKERTLRLSETVAELEAFSYSVSHDMRAPLRAMRGYSSHMVETYGGQLDPEGRRYLERIDRAAGRLDKLVQDILTYSRLARAQLPLQPVDLEKLVEDIVQQYPNLQPPQTHVRVHKPLPRVLGHEAALTQVIANLLGNAAKFVAPGQPARVDVRAEPLEGGLRLWFEDQGIGIAEKDLGRIFNIFERVHPEHAYDGTGIGLSIVRKAIERMGGQVGVESVLGQGSRFWIQLRRAD